MAPLDGAYTRGSIIALGTAKKSRSTRNTLFPEIPFYRFQSELILHVNTAARDITLKLRLRLGHDRKFHEWEMAPSGTSTSLRLNHDLLTVEGKKLANRGHFT